MIDLSKAFCDKLRQAGAALGKGEQSEIVLPLHFITVHFADEPEKAKSITPGYIRTIINRVPEVKAVGSCSVKSGSDGDGNPAYIMTMKANTKRRVITSDDLPGLESRWRAKFIKHLLETTPRITDLQGDRLTGAAIALERFAAMLEKMAKPGEE